MEHFYQGIPGWFDFHDTYRRWVAEVPDGGTIVEVGTYMGRSAAFLAVEAINSGKRLELCCVDTWEGSPEMQHILVVKEGRMYEQCVANLAPVEGALTLLRGSSVDKATLFEDASVDRVWLDGDHTTAGLLADFEAWWPKVKPGGELGGHDFGWFGVTPAVERFAQRHGLVIEVMAPCPEAGTVNVGHSFLLRKPAKEWRAETPAGERSVLVCPVSNHPFVPRQTVASLGAVMLHAREQAASVGFRCDFHWEAEAFTLDTLRDRAVYRALSDGFSHILFLDADNVWPHDLLKRLLPLHGLGVVGGLYHGKNPPYEAVALVKAHDDPNPNMYRKLPHIHEETEPQEVDALGMGCTLIPLALCRAMGRPWFKFQADEYGWMKVTEDIWFCQRAKAHGARLWVDPTLNVGHVSHSVVGVNSYLPHVAMVEKAHRAKARERAKEQAK
jgi:hypothetical protein